MKKLIPAFGVAALIIISAVTVFASESRGYPNGGVEYPMHYYNDGHVYHNNHSQNGSHGYHAGEIHH